MNTQKFEPIIVEKMDRHFRKKGVNIIKEIDTIKSNISFEEVNNFCLSHLGTKYDNSSDYINTLASTFKFYDQMKSLMYNNTSIYMSSIFSMYNALKHKHVFNFTPEIFFKLINTEIKNVNPDIIRMPFNTLVLSAPIVSLKLKSSDLTLVFRDLVLNYDEISHTIVVQSYGEIHKGEQSILEQSGFPIDLKRKSVTDMLDHAINILRKVKVRENSTNPIEEDIQIYTHYFNFIINSLLYITSVDTFNTTHAKFYSPKKKKNKANRLQEATKVEEKNINLSKIDRIVIGSNRKLSLDESEVFTDLKKLISCPKWLVRGHWRQQACGINKTDRRLKWIKPYMKGKGLVEELETRDYLVKD